MKKMLKKMKSQLSAETMQTANALAEIHEMNFEMFWNEFDEQTKQEFRDWYKKEVEEEWDGSLEDDVVLQVFSELLD
jgi:hypothetical protein